MLEKAYKRDQLQQTREALLQARQLTEQLATEYLNATDAITRQNTFENSPSQAD